MALALTVIQAAVSEAHDNSPLLLLVHYNAIYMLQALEQFSAAVWLLVQLTSFIDPAASHSA